MRTSVTSCSFNVPGARPRALMWRARALTPTCARSAAHAVAMEEAAAVHAQLLRDKEQRVSEVGRRMHAF